MSYVVECGLIEQTGLVGTLENFVGKKKELLAAEKEIAKIIDYVKDSPVHLFDGKKKNDKSKPLALINTIKPNKELEKYLIKLFRFKTLRVIWDVNPIANAATYPNSFSAFDTNYKVDQDGINYNEKLNAVILMDLGLITSAKLTPGEIMSIMLHEVGHIFDTSIAFTVSLLCSGAITTVQKAIIDGVFYYGGLHLTVYDLIEKINSKFPGFMDAMNYITNTIGITLKLIDEIRLLSIMYRMVDYFFKASTMVIGRVLYINPIHTLMRYNMEKNADKFSGDYGYGAESASATIKMKKANGPIFVDKIPIVGWIYDFNMLPINMFIYYAAGYPTDLNRSRTMIDNYEKYLTDPEVPEEAKKQIKLALDEMKRHYEFGLSIKNDENKKEIFSWASRNINEYLFKGKGDIRELSRIKLFNSRA